METAETVDGDSVKCELSIIRTAWKGATLHVDHFAVARRHRGASGSHQTPLQDPTSSRHRRTDSAATYLWLRRNQRLFGVPVQGDPKRSSEANFGVQYFGFCFCVLRNPQECILGGAPVNYTWKSALFAKGKATSVLVIGLKREASCKMRVRLQSFVDDESNLWNGRLGCMNKATASACGRVLLACGGGTAGLVRCFSSISTPATCACSLTCLSCHCILSLIGECAFSVSYCTVPMHVFIARGDGDIDPAGMKEPAAGLMSGRGRTRGRES